MTSSKRTVSALILSGLLWVVPASTANAGINLVNVGGSQSNSGSHGGGGVIGGLNAVNAGGRQSNDCGGINAVNVGLLGGGGQRNDTCADGATGLLGGVNAVNVGGSQTNG